MLLWSNHSGHEKEKSQHELQLVDVAVLIIMMLLFDERLFNQNSYDMWQAACTGMTLYCSCELYAADPLLRYFVLWHVALGHCCIVMPHCDDVSGAVSLAVLLSLNLLSLPELSVLLSVVSAVYCCCCCVSNRTRQLSHLALQRHKNT